MWMADVCAMRAFAELRVNVLVALLEVMKCLNFECQC